MEGLFNNICPHNRYQHKMLSHGDPIVDEQCVQMHGWLKTLGHSCYIFAMHLSQITLYQSIIFVIKIFFYTIKKCCLNTKNWNFKEVGNRTLVNNWIKCGFTKKKCDDYLSKMSSFQDGWMTFIKVISVFVFDFGTD